MFPSSIRSTYLHRTDLISENCLTFVTKIFVYLIYMNSFDWPIIIDHRQIQLLDCNLCFNENTTFTILTATSSTKLYYMLFMLHMMTAFWRYEDDSKLSHHNIFCTLSLPTPQFLIFNDWRYLFQIKVYCSKINQQLWNHQLTCWETGDQHTITAFIMRTKSGH